MLRTLLIGIGLLAARELVKMPAPLILAFAGLLAAFTAIAWGSEAAWALPRTARWKVAVLVGGSYLAWIILDWGMLAALPTLGISYGAIGLGFSMLAITRSGIFIGSALVIKMSSRWQKSWQSPDATRRQVAVLWLANLGLTALAGYSLYFEPLQVQVSRVNIAGPDFLPDRSLRILQISDLHLERLTQRELQVMAQVDTLQPDLIVLTGDYLNLDFLDDPVAMAEARQFMAQLKAPNGVFAVVGTVDGPAQMQALFAGLDIVVLDDQAKDIHLPGGDLHIIGISNFALNRDSKALLDMEILEDDYNLLLYHTPDMIHEAAQSGVDLYLAGHTHGGQVRLPFYGALITFSIYGKQYESGMHEVEDTILYVSRGLGMEGMGFPRARFLCPPELVLIEIGNAKP